MWRAGGQTSGGNDIPLGSRRRFGGGDGAGLPPPPMTTSFGGQQATTTVPIPASAAAAAAPPSSDEPRKRRSRWGDASATVEEGRDLAITAKVDSKEIELYSIKVRLEEISRKIRTGDVFPPTNLPRSPSPPPQYDNLGKRTNTRDVRYRQKLDLEQTRLIDRAFKLDPNFRPPLDPQPGMLSMYGNVTGGVRRGGRYQEKIYVPVNEFPEINFIGLLIGPRGNTLKTMERESGAKIGIRGKGSVKEGKGRSDAAATSNQEEDLHCVVSAEEEEKVRKAIQLINQVIETAASVPESANDHKRNQLRLLAELNGTLRDDENQVCQNCGNIGHRRFDCPEQRNVTRDITCHTCGGMGHIARDCPQRFGGGAGTGANMGPLGGPTAGAIGGPGTEYEALMRELGEGGTGNGGVATAAGALTNGAGGQATTTTDQSNHPHAIHGKVPPWRDPNFWNPPAQARPQGQQHYGSGGGVGGGGGGYYSGGAYDAYFAHSQPHDAQVY